MFGDLHLPKGKRGIALPMERMQGATLELIYFWLIID